MKAGALSSAFTVTETKAAAALADPMLRRIVASFVGEMRSIGEVSDATGMDLKRLHYHVVRLRSLGLLKVAGERRRRGRAVKLYRARAETFYVPHEAAPELFSEGLARDLRRSVHADAHRSANGMLLSVDPEGILQLQPVSGNDEAGRGPEMWLVLRLQPAEADALRRDLRAVLERHAASASGRGKVHLVHAAVVERVGPTVTDDNVRR
jgi:DNA-binding transcriptional ArsR family regulator